MLKGILGIKGVSELKKQQQATIRGGVNYDPQVCIQCQGVPLPNGGCFISEVNEPCLEGLDG
ncbi:hypothetical protein [Kordia sp.]|uniref:hypothetical protein n=1 Tax=Kordia sp. TaxID=1965332 RepID=UPI003D2E4E9D